MQIILHIIFTILFLTRIPLPQFVVTKTKNVKLASVIWCFPLFGLLIGGLVAAFVLLLQWLAVPLSLQVILALGFGVLLTGALHEDGFADFFDGLGVRDRERALKVMREPQLGSFGGLALLFSFAFRGAALFELGPLLVTSLLLMHAGARGMILPLLLLPMASDNGLAHGAGRPRMLIVAVGLFITLALLLSLLSLKVALIAFVAGLLAVGLVGFVALRRLGGMTGDVYGAAEQVAEMSLLTVLVLFIS